MRATTPRSLQPLRRSRDYAASSDGVTPAPVLEKWGSSAAAGCPLSGEVGTAPPQLSRSKMIAMP
jgi:hypothetical protein